MLEKTISQKIARALEIADYFLLIPAAFGIFWATIFIFAAPLFTLVVWIIAVIGIALMVGYFKHSRGRLSEKYVSLLWAATAFYNFLLSIPFLFSTFVFLKAENMYVSINDEQLNAIIFVIVCSTIYLVIITLSVVAYKYRNQKLQ